MRSIIIIVSIIVLLAAAVTPAAIAYDEPHASIAAEPAAQQQRGEAELPWLFAVYAVTWAAFFGYVFVMSRRQRELQREIDALQRALRAKDDKMD